MNKRLCIALCLLGSIGCGVSRESARDQAATHACKRFDECGAIGQGKQFATTDACLVDQRAFWDDHFPASSCQGKIDASKLDICEKAIDIVDCNNIFDIAVTLATKCSVNAVCSGGSTPDGG